MSVQAMTWVLDHAPADLKPQARLVLISIANHADREGSESWPKIATICRETGLGERQVQRWLASLVDDRLVEIEVNAGGSHRLAADRRPNRYTITAMQRGVTDDTPRGDTYDTPGVSSTTPRGVSPTTPPIENRPSEPSDEPPPTPPAGGPESASSVVGCLICGGAGFRVTTSNDGTIETDPCLLDDEHGYVDFADAEQVRRAVEWLGDRHDGFTPDVDAWAGQLAAVPAEAFRRTVKAYGAAAADKPPGSPTDLARYTAVESRRMAESGDPLLLAGPPEEIGPEAAIEEARRQLRERHSGSET